MTQTTNLTLYWKEYHYVFEAYWMDVQFNSVEGIYAFIKLNSDSSIEVLYVGQTNDMASRMSNHEHMQEAKNLWMNCICYCRFNTQQERDKYEEDLIRSYKPPCNTLLKKPPFTY